MLDIPKPLGQVARLVLPLEEGSSCLTNSGESGVTNYAAPHPMDLTLLPYLLFALCLLAVSIVYAFPHLQHYVAVTTCLLACVP